jgi:hypothetical protein
MAVALQAVHEVLGDSLARTNALRALELVLNRFDGERGSDQFELLGGNAIRGLAILERPPRDTTKRPASGRRQYSA